MACSNCALSEITMRLRPISTADVLRNPSRTAVKLSRRHPTITAWSSLHNCRFVVGLLDQQRRNPARYVVEHLLFKAVPGIQKPSGEDVDETQSPFRVLKHQ